MKITLTPTSINLDIEDGTPVRTFRVLEPTDGVTLDYTIPGDPEPPIIRRIVIRAETEEITPALAGETQALEG